MTEREKTKLGKELETLANELLHTMGLSDWLFTFMWVCTQDLRNECNRPLSDGTPTFGIEPSWYYRQAVIKVNIDTVPFLSKEERKSILIHEYIHAILSPAEIKSWKMEELVTTHLTLAIERAYNKGLKDGSKNRN